MTPPVKENIRMSHIPNNRYHTMANIIAAYEIGLTEKPDTVMTNINLKSNKQRRTSRPGPYPQ